MVPTGCEDQNLRERPYTGLVSTIFASYGKGLLSGEGHSELGQGQNIDYDEDTREVPKH